MRPFSLGDRIILRHVSGMVVLEGVVAALHPTRTVIVGEPELAVDASSGQLRQRLRGAQADILHQQR